MRALQAGTLEWHSCTPCFSYAGLSLCSGQLSATCVVREKSCQEQRLSADGRMRADTHPQLPSMAWLLSVDWMAAS